MSNILLVVQEQMRYFLLITLQSILNILVDVKILLQKRKLHTQ